MSSSGVAGTLRTDAPAMMKPNWWIGYDGLGTRMVSPGLVTAAARLASPSLEPSVAITSVSGSSPTSNRRA